MTFRASFWVGDPCDLQSREYLGSLTQNGHPAFFVLFENAYSEDRFRDIVGDLASQVGFVGPARPWPFPWTDDIFLTDYTYAWLAGTVQVCRHDQGFVNWKHVLTCRDPWGRHKHPSCQNVPAPQV